MVDMIRKLLEQWRAMAASAPGGPADSGPDTALPFKMEAQKQVLWCWAATSVSINRYFNSGSQWTQCLLANAVLGRSTCCGTGGPAECNVCGVLKTVLELVNNLERMEGRHATLDEVKSAIDSGKPLCARIEWSDGTGHFLAIYGYNDDTLLIGDPLTTESRVPYDQFLRRYQEYRMRWTDTYWVKA